MAKPKRKLTAEQRRRKRERRQNFEQVFIHGKQKWVRRPPMIEGMLPEDFIARNADPIWLVQEEMWELLYLVEREYSWELPDCDALNRELDAAAREFQEALFTADVWE